MKWNGPGGYGSDYPKDALGRFVLPGGAATRTPTTPLCRCLVTWLATSTGCRRRSRDSRMFLECRPALDVIRCYGRHPDNLIYADPPYLRGTRGSGRLRLEMADERQHTVYLLALAIRH